MIADQDQFIFPCSFDLQLLGANRGRSHYLSSAPFPFLNISLRPIANASFDEHSVAREDFTPKVTHSFPK